MGKSMHIKRNDVVSVISGSAATGRRNGKVLRVFPSKGTAIVEGMNYIKKTIRKSQDNPNGAIVEKEAPIAISNLMLYCPHCKMHVKIARERADKMSRKCKRCGHSFDD